MDDIHNENAVEAETVPDHELFEREVIKGDDDLMLVDFLLAEVLGRK